MIDDDSAYLDALVVLVSSMGFSPQPFTSGTQFLQTFDGAASSCVIVDLKLPDIHGLSLIENLATLRVPPPIVVLTGHGDVRSAVRAVRHGVVAFLEKQNLSETALWEAIQQAFQRDADNRAMLAREDNLKARLQELTPGEYQVFELLAKGLDHTAIAESLAVSRRTVENRRSKLMKKLKAKTFADLITLAVEAGVI
jgi:two-component system response regulator FixJ